MGAVFLGVDGGGTKTAYAAVDELGAVLGTFEGETTNYNQVGFDGVETALRIGIDHTLSRAGMGLGEVVGAIIGIGGVGEIAAEMAVLEPAVARALRGIPFRLVNDSEVGWAGGLGLMPGINVVAGTGSIAFGRDESGRSMRVGGWAWRIGDEGSAHWLGRQIIQIFTKQSDGRLDRTPLYHCVRERLALREDIEIRSLAETLPRRDVAGLAQLLPQAMAVGDATPAELYRLAGVELALHVRALRKALSFGPVVSVSCSGGVFSSQHYVLDAFRRSLDDMSERYEPPLTSPVLGATLLAVERFRPDAVEAIRTALLGTSGVR